MAHQSHPAAAQPGPKQRGATAERQPPYGRAGKDTGDERCRRAIVSTRGESKSGEDRDEREDRHGIGQRQHERRGIRRRESRPSRRRGIPGWRTDERANTEIAKEQAAEEREPDTIRD